MTPLRAFVGFDSREPNAWGVCEWSMHVNTTAPLHVTRLELAELRRLGLYRRPIERTQTGLWDVISRAPMSTEFAISRFLVPHLAREGWALFCDGDFLWRADVGELYALADERYAVMVVKHQHHPIENTKMRGQAQLDYPRKNWSSLILFNCSHAANAALTLDLVNAATGRELHRFCWLKDRHIGALPEEWNWLEGHSLPSIEPKAVHFTRGTPDIEGYEETAYADEWWAILNEARAAMPLHLNDFNERPHAPARAVN